MYSVRVKVENDSFFTAKKKQCTYTAAVITLIGYDSMALGSYLHEHVLYMLTTY